MTHNNELKGKKLLILAGADVHTKVVEAAKAFGVHTIVTDYLSPEDAPAKKAADEYWMLNIMDTESIAARCRKEHIDGVLAFCIDPAQIPYLCVCEKLGVPCYGTREQFEILTNKRKFKDYCVQHGVEVIPEYTIDDVYNDRVVYPILVKPTDSRGSRGQTICYERSQVEAAINIARTESHDGGYLIERYMQGCQDMSFAYVVINNEPYLLKLGDRYVGNVEDGLDRQQIATVLPSRNAAEYIQKVEPSVKKMIQALGFQFGAVFLQGFYENGHVYMYDPGLRFPGSDFDIVIRDTTGYDNMATFVRFALTGDTDCQVGNPVDAWRLNGNICLILSIAVREGKICTFSGIDCIAADPHVVSVSQRYHCGDYIKATGDIGQRVAEFVACLPNRDAVKCFVDSVYKKIQILDENGENMIVSKLNYT